MRTLIEELSRSHQTHRTTISRRILVRLWSVVKDAYSGIKSPNVM